MKNYGKSRWSALAALLLAGVLSAGTIVQAGDTVTVDGVEGSPFEITAMPGDPQATEHDLLHAG